LNTLCYFRTANSKKEVMKKIIPMILLFAAISVNAQFNQAAPWMQGQDFKNATGKIKFQEVVDAFNIYWETRDPDVKGSGFKPFKRWEAYWQNFVGPDGYLPSSASLFNVAYQVSQTRNAQDDESNWTSLGPTNFLNRPTSSANIGRVNVIIQDPNNANRLFSGAPAGGIWRSLDSGQNWTPLIDDLPQIGVSGIAIDYNNSNIIYIATGDDDAGDANGVGVWKSIDGGDSWNPTGLNPSNSPSRMNDIYIHPTNSNILWVATTSGVFKTTNGGDNWTNVRSGNIRDLKINPGNPNIVYAVSSSIFYKSTDGGDSFTPSTIGLPTSSTRLAIDVTPANNNVVYVVSAGSGSSFQGVYKSTNSGTSFTQTAVTQNIFNSTQAWYDLALAVSDTDEDELYVGVLDIWKSSNGGDSFSQINQWFSRTPSYTHADIHFLRFYDGELYCGSDGGFFRSDNGGNTFTDLTVGMEISQFYRISVSQQTSTKIAGGTQDNGGFAYNNEWSHYHGGDGMEGVIDPVNDNLFYGFMQFGQNLFISNNSGQSGSSAISGPENGNWITPLAVNSDGEVYGGYSSLYRLNGSSWAAVSSSFGTNIDALEIDSSNPDNMYVAINNSLRKSTDRGASFENVESFSSNITSIEVNNNNSDIVYVTTSGTTNGRVFRSVDAGNTFTNITGSLPNVSKNIVKHQTDTSINTLYLGTSVGIYRYDDNLADWEAFSNNLPNTSVRDLAINIPDNKIVAGTYGRGIWISDLVAVPLSDNDVRLVNIQGVSSSSIACGSITPQVEVKNNGLNTITSINVEYTIDGTSENFTWTGSLVSEESTLVDIPELSLARGEHELSVTTSIANDAFPSNNTAQLTFYVNDAGTAQLVNTFEGLADALISTSDSGEILWERGVPQGTLLNTASSGTNVYGTNLDGNHPDATKAYLVSQCYDLSQITLPVLKFNMAFDLEFDWDITYVEYSINEGQTWSHLGTGTVGDIWYNSTRIAGDGAANNCFNCVGGQWTGTDATMTQYSKKLTELTDESSVIFRIVFHSDQSVNEEGVIIDDFLVDGTLSNDEFSTQNVSVFPNPSKGIFTVKTKNIANLNYQVVDITGKVILKDSLKNKNEFTINMSPYSSGMYFLSISDNTGKNLTKKIVLE
jgi:photosystem II stability/assembly factor-like uncharacterized protein